MSARLRRDVVLLAHVPTSICTLDSMLHLFILKNSR